MHLRLIFADERMTKFMQAADVFERFKVMYGGILDVEVTLDCTKTLASVIQHLRDKDDPKKGCRLIAAFVPGVPSDFWIDDSVKSISTGAKWGLFADFLATLGFVKPVPVEA